MQNKMMKAKYVIVPTIFSLIMVSFAIAEGKIIKEEKLSFEKCLKVIKTSENKLSIAPEIKDMTDKKRVAIFTLADGTLTIECDGIASKVIVLTNKN